MSQKKAFLPSLLTSKCPRCREGNMFVTEKLYTTKFADMHEKCPCCGENFEPEPGFYYGAMYVSFAFNVGIFLVLFFLLYQFLEDISILMMIGIMAVAVVTFLPIIFRLSRALWLYMFVKYEGPCNEIAKK